MYRRLAPFAVAGLALSACVATHPQVVTVARANRRVTVAQVLKYSVRVVVSAGGEDRRAATGVVIAQTTGAKGPISYVVTNEHVVNPAGLEAPLYSVLVEDPQGVHTYPASLAAEGAVPAMDLAVLAVPGIRLEPATLAGDEELAIGDDVVVIGAPYGRSLSVAGGLLSQVEYHLGEPQMLKTDAAIGYGVSGGGMFSIETGHLVGIIEGYRTAQVQIPMAKESYSFDVPMPGETFAAPMAKLRHFLSDHHLASAKDQPPPLVPGTKA